MVNHLHRTNPQKRHDQSHGIKEWAQQQPLPVITVGDYNYDWNIPTGHNRDVGFDLLLADGLFSWVVPSNLIRTQCSEPLKGDSLTLCSTSCLCQGMQSSGQRVLRSWRIKLTTAPMILRRAITGLSERSLRLGRHWVQTLRARGERAKERALGKQALGVKDGNGIWSSI